MKQQFLSLASPLLASSIGSVLCFTSPTLDTREGTKRRGYVILLHPLRHKREALCCYGLAWHKRRASPGEGPPYFATPLFWRMGMGRPDFTSPLLWHGEPPPILLHLPKQKKGAALLRSHNTPPWHKTGASIFDTRRSLVFRYTPLLTQWAAPPDFATTTLWHKGVLPLILLRPPPGPKRGAPPSFDTPIFWHSESSLYATLFFVHEGSPSNFATHSLGQEKGPPCFA